MGRMKGVTVRCGVCGETQEQVMLATTVLMPVTMDFCAPHAFSHQLLQECPHCGYVAKDLSLPLGLPAEILRGEDYRNGEMLHPEDPAERKFFRYAILCRERGEHLAAGWAFLYAANASQYDEGSRAPGHRFTRRYRRLALGEFEQVVFVGPGDGAEQERIEFAEMDFPLLGGPEERERVELACVDALRRIGKFGRANQRARRIRPALEGSAVFLAYQRHLLSIRDRQRHLLEEAYRWCHNNQGTAKEEE